ncbi:MAG: histidine kinase dimerization/phospho-acceptor domain-containing protein, partial [Rhodoluna sp.]
MAKPRPETKKGSLISWWDQRSLRLKLTVISLSAVGTLLFVFVNGSVIFFRSFIQQNSDSLLISSAATMSNESPLTVGERFSAGEISLPPLPSDYYIAFLDPQGGLYLGLVSSAATQHPVPNLSQFNVVSVAATNGVPFTADIARGSGEKPQEWRLVALPLQGMAGSVVVGIPETHNKELLNQYRVIGFGFSGLLLVIMGAALWLSINSALKPLREVSAAAEQVRKGKFDSRLPQLEGENEIAVLNRSLNEMLGSIEGSLKDRNQTVDRMKQFVADASHELRTPLVTLRGYAELYRKGAFKKKSDVDEAMAKIENEAIRMSNLVESLLALARLDNQTGLQLSRANLTEIITSVIDNITAGYPETKISAVNLNGAVLN